MSTTKSVLRHCPYDTPPGIAELQFPTTYTSDDIGSVNVSATVRDGVLILTSSVPALSADAARQVAAQLVEAATWVDAETAKR